MGDDAVRAIDTNVLVRLATRDDEKQARAADECISSGAWVSHVVLAETAWVLMSLYGASRIALAGAVARFLDHVSLVVQDADVVRAALAHFEQSKSLSFPDCLILEIARKAGQVPLCTFDRDLAKLDGAQLISAKA